MNPGKRKRTMDHEGAITFADLSDTFEKIASGEGHFKSLKGDLDAFNTVRKDIWYKVWYTLCVAIKNIK